MSAPDKKAGVEPGEGWELLGRTKQHWCSADACREWNLRVGDVLMGREMYPNGWWSEARITLLFIGNQATVWRTERRSSQCPDEWFDDGDSTNWTLNSREWYRRIAHTQPAQPDGAERAADKIIEHFRDELGESVSESAEMVGAIGDIIRAELAATDARVRELEALVEFIRAKLAGAERALRCREQAEKCWRGGTDESWKKVGCRMSRAERLAVAAKEASIAIRCRQEVKQFQGVLVALVARKEAA